MQFLVLDESLKYVLEWITGEGWMNEMKGWMKSGYLLLSRSFEKICIDQIVCIKFLFIVAVSADPLVPPRGRPPAEQHGPLHHRQHLRHLRRGLRRRLRRGGPQEALLPALRLQRQSLHYRWVTRIRHCFEWHWSNYFARLREPKYGFNFKEKWTTSLMFLRFKSWLF